MRHRIRSNPVHEKIKAWQNSFTKVASHHREVVLAPLTGCARPALRGSS